MSRFAWLCALWFTAGALPPVVAQQHFATRLGNPATRFADPLQTPDDLRRMLTSEKLRADVDFIARESGFKGDLEELRSAARTAKILELRIPHKSVMKAMSTREKGQPVLLREVMWMGQEPIEAYEFYFASQGRRYRVVTPKPCANFWVEDYGVELRPVLTMQCSVPEEVILGRPARYCLVVTNSGTEVEPATEQDCAHPGAGGTGAAARLQSGWQQRPVLSVGNGTRRGWSDDGCGVSGNAYRGLPGRTGGQSRSGRRPVRNLLAAGALRNTGRRGAGLAQGNPAPTRRYSQRQNTRTRRAT